MSIVQRLGYLTGARPLSAIQEDIRSEFAFHIDAVTDELLAQGLSPEAAKEEAERRFGNQDNIRKECQSIQTGPLRSLARVGMIGGTISLLIIGCLTYFLMVLVHQNQVLSEKLQYAKYQNQKSTDQASEPSLVALVNPEPSNTFPLVEPIQNEKKESLRGKVMNAEGKPVPNAKVVLIHKSWPNSKFRMDNDVTETDKAGNYLFADLYSTSGDNEFLVTIFAQGNEMKSEYLSTKAKKKASAIDFRLKPAKAITFQVIDPDKKPLAETDVVLLSRKVGTKEHMIYPASSNDAKWSTDEKGKVEMNFLNEGETAKFGVLIFGEIQTIEVKISAESEQVISLQKKR